jgi:hypothetical protein
MHLVYLDESGNSGNNLNDLQQPIFVLCGLIVPEREWISLERELEEAALKFWGTNGFMHVEIHMHKLRGGLDVFSLYSIDQRLEFISDWFKIAQKHGVKVVYRAIVKKKYQEWLKSSFGSGMQINPHIIAFPLLARVVNEYLKNLHGSPLGIFISDENKEVVHDVEKSLKSLRAFEGKIQLTQIIEKGFFIDSSKSLLLQFCDLCAFAARKKEEEGLGRTMRSIDIPSIKLLEPLIHRGDEGFQDVINWVKQQQQSKK